MMAAVAQRNRLDIALIYHGIGALSQRSPRPSTEAVAQENRERRRRNMPRGNRNGHFISTDEAKDMAR
uniref:Uncharacterized protein n=1 Tax=Arundo donax TaxID=35708 RepID=A0A0A9AW68_ARUDO